ncbi:MAG: pirin family protein [Chlorobi bacterium]|nr:MAG: pirin family protein [Bacteroidota bacterium]KXK34977.1 MAG: Pirin-like protein [Chlorobi bacterium OLB6]MBE2265155.1 pirin family protein [Flavobacteriales bacterium]MBL1161982.1 pirin family protein [Chlorobiota bacterium]MBW7854497.1 pirin family protein [Candidatus Kapabacteria bacterium]MCC6331774.1 pirin family protein [Ignavibacteria bacterium]
MRTIKIVTSGLTTSVGPLRVAQPLPVHALRDADPFILLHHAGPQTFEPGSEVHKVEEHPHRGFEPVTFVYKGSVLHRDSLGNEGVIGDDEVQWITSGRGIMHEEGPTAEMASQNGTLELIQLWVNLPANKKLMDPAYQELHRDLLPVVTALDGKAAMRVVAGTYMNTTGPAVTQSPIVAVMGRITEGAKGTLELPPLDTTLLYVLGGTLTVGDQSVDEKRLVLFNPPEQDMPDSNITVEAHSDARILLVAGKPHGEPIATYGPFVMNTEEELHDAFRDLAGGKFGSIYG